MKEQVLAVQRMQDYIENNLEGNIGLSDLSNVSMYSPWYSYRLFKEYTGLTPADYIRRLRLAKAALQIKNDHTRLIDTAFNLGFKSADGFTRAFTREFGMCPSAYASNPVPITLFVPYGAKFRALRKEITIMENTNKVFIQVVRKPQRKVICKRGIKAKDYFPYCEEVGCDVWGILLSMDSLCGEPVCLWLPKHLIKENTSTYVQGVEVADDYNGPIPEGFDIISLPAADYLMFQGEPFEEENYNEAISFIQQCIKEYDPSIIGYIWDDSNPKIQLEPRGKRGYIELRAVKRK